MATRLELILAATLEGDGFGQAQARVEEFSNSLRNMDLEMHLGVAEGELEDLEPRIGELQEELRSRPLELSIGERVGDMIEGVGGKWEEVRSRITSSPAVASLVDRASPVISELRERTSGLERSGIEIPVAVVGGEEAVSTLNEVAEARRRAEQVPSAPPSDELRGVKQLAEYWTEVAENKRQAARQAAGGLDSEKEVQRLNKQAKAAAASAEQMRNLANATEKEALKNIKAGQSLDQMIVSLEKATAAENRRAAALLKAGKHSDAKIHLARAQAINRERNSIDRLNKDLNRTAVIARTAAEELNEKFADVTSLKEFENRAKELRDEFKKLKQEALSSGKGVQGLLEVAEKEQGLKKLSEQAIGTKRTFRLLGNEMGFLEKIMSSSFNQLGFVMFVTGNTIKSLIGVFKSLGEQIEKAADSANRFAVISAALDGTSQSASEFSAELRGITQGFVEYETAIGGATKLIVKAGAAYASLAGDIGLAAKRLELFTGGVENAEETYSALIDALSSSDLSGVVDITGFEDLGDELQIAEWRADRLGQSFSDIDAESLAFELVAERIALINEELAEVDDAATDIRSGWASLGDFFDSLWTGIGAGLGTVGGNVNDVNDSMGDLGITAREVGAALAVGLGTPIFAARALLVAFKTVVDAFGQLMKDITPADEMLDFLLTLEPLALFLAGDLAGAADSAKGAIDRMLSGDFSQLTEGAEEAATAIKDGVGTAANAVADFATGGFARQMGEDVMAELEATGQAWIDYANTIGIAAGIMTDESSEAINGAYDSLLNTPVAIRKQAGKQIVEDVFGGLEEALGFITGPEKDFLDGLDAEAIKHQEKLNEIQTSFEEGREKDQAKRDEARLDAQDAYNEKSADIADDLTDKIENINDDLNTRIKRLAEDGFQKRQRQQEKSSKKLEDIEEDHQKKINDIQRKFDLSRLKALIDRDARALFEAEQKRNEDLRKAAASAKEKRDNEIESNNDKLKQMADDEAKSIRRAAEDAEKRRQDARDAHKKAMDDLGEQHQEKLDKIEENFQDARELAHNERAEDRKKEHDDHKKRMAQMESDFKQTQDMLDFYKLQENIIMLKNLDPMSASYKETFDSIYNDAEALVGNMEVLLPRWYAIQQEFSAPVVVPQVPYFGDGGSAPPPPGGGGGGSYNGCVPGHNITYNPNLGDPCSQVASTMTVTACNGSKWQCYNGTWIPAGTVQADTQQVGALSTGTNQGGDSPWYGVGGAPQQAQITLVTNDAKLDAILNEVVYDAYIDIMT